MSVKEEEFMSGNDIITELYGVAKHYGSVRAMCAQSNRMKADTGSESQVINILDAAIAIQIYSQLKKKEVDQEILDEIKKVFHDNISSLLE